MLKETQEIYSDDILHKALELFGGSKEKCNDLGGFEAFVYEIEINSKPYIMKITHTIRRTVDYIMGELEFVNYLEGHGVPTSKAVPSLSGKFVETINAPDGGQFLGYMFEKAPGKLSKVTEWTDDFISTWGQTAGMITRLAKTFMPSDTKYKRRLWYEDDVYNFDKYIPPIKVDTIDNCKKIIAEAKSLDKDADSFGMIHGDFHQGNFFVENGTITPFDFDDCEYGFYINEIAMPLYYASPNKYNVREDERSNEQFGEYFLEHFLRGYRKENQIDKEWILKIPLFLKVRSVILYTIFHQIHLNEGINEDIAALIERLRVYIDGEKEMIDIDFRKFC